MIKITTNNSLKLCNIKYNKIKYMNINIYRIFNRIYIFIYLYSNSVINVYFIEEKYVNYEEVVTIRQSCRKRNNPESFRED